MVLSIGDVARTAGTNTSALRYYEQVGLLPKPERVNGQRRYDQDVIRRIQMIKIAQKAGFQIQEIQFVLQGLDSNIPPSERWETMVVKKREELEEKMRQINNMLRILDTSLQCSCLSWDECMQKLIQE